MFHRSIPPSLHPWPMFIFSPYLYSNLTLNAPTDYPNSIFSLQQTHFTRRQLRERSRSERKHMEMAMMMDVEDDDVFFADLNRQISLLITDDEDEHGYYYSPPISSYHTAAVSIQAFSRTAAIYPPTQPQYQFDQTSYKTTTPDQSKGTGVFIPKSSQFCRSRRTKHQTKASNNYSSYNRSSSHKSSSYTQQQLPSQAVFAQFMTPNNC